MAYQTSHPLLPQILAIELAQNNCILSLFALQEVSCRCGAQLWSSKFSALLLLELQNYSN